MVTAVNGCLYLPTAIVACASQLPQAQETPCMASFVYITQLRIYLLLVSNIPWTPKLSKGKQHPTSPARIHGRTTSCCKVQTVVRLTNKSICLFKNRGYSRFETTSFRDYFLASETINRNVKPSCWAYGNRTHVTTPLSTDLTAGLRKPLCLLTHKPFSNMSKLNLPKATQNINIGID